MRTIGSSNPSGDYWLFFSFLLHCFFFFCQETIYRKVAFVFPFLVLKKSSGAFNHSFISIPFELTISRGFVKEKPWRLSLNRIAKQHTYKYTYIHTCIHTYILFCFQIKITIITCPQIAELISGGHVYSNYVVCIQYNIERVYLE